MIADAINKYLDSQQYTVSEAILESVGRQAAWCFKRQFMENGEREGIGLSGSGHCARQLAYKYHGIPTEGKAIDARAKTIFWLGDLAESTVIHLAELAGVVLRKVGQDQATVTLNVNGKEIEGHPDGIVVCPDKMRLLEVKSMSSYGFKEFEDGTISPDYLAQVNIYMDLMGFDECCMVAVAKDSGVIKEQMLVKSTEIVAQAKANLATVVDSTPDNLPPRKFGPDHKGKLPWNCTYCNSWRTCWPKAEQVVSGGRYSLKTPVGDIMKD